MSGLGELVHSSDWQNWLQDSPGLPGAGQNIRDTHVEKGAPKEHPLPGLGQCNIE